ncbi:MAG: glycosyltransferase family 4 protein [Chitinophagaceae bacterium]
MPTNTNNIRIVFFIGSLRSGGKERRLIELLTFLKKENRYDMLLVMTKHEIHYPTFFELGIPFQILKKKSKKDLFSVFLQFYTVCRQFKPHVVHTWGRIQTFYSLPTVVLQKRSLVNSQIAGVPTRHYKFSASRFIDQLNFYFSHVILSNSQAGITTYRPPQKRFKVIYNGMNLERFEQLPAKESVKKEFGIETPYAIIMVGSYTFYKDYHLFYNLAEEVTRQRNDITFLGVGGYDKDDTFFQSCKKKYEGNINIKVMGKVEGVEAIVNACDIGVLFSPNGEGMSNAILEYMALGKPVIATNTGGNVELITHGKNGYLVPVKATAQELVPLVFKLIDDENVARQFGSENRSKVKATFTITQMGKAFKEVYSEVLA